MTRIAGVFLVIGTLLLIGGIAMLSVPASVITAGVLVCAIGALNMERP
jgi:hypothetical protein